MHKQSLTKYCRQNKIDSKVFLRQFYNINLPQPKQVSFLPQVCYLGWEQKKKLHNPQFKSDLKLLIEIVTGSRLKSSQDKKDENKQIMYCRAMGRDCYKLQVTINQAKNTFTICDDYNSIKHQHECQKDGDDKELIEVYNLMMLKRELIEKYILDNQLSDKSPEAILSKISKEGQPSLSMLENCPHPYFYVNRIEDPENRRKLKKRFDNIVNITIKKKWELANSTSIAEKAPKKVGNASKNSELSPQEKQNPQKSESSAQKAKRKRINWKNLQSSIERKCQQDQQNSEPRKRKKMSTKSLENSTKMKQSINQQIYEEEEEQEQHENIFKNYTVKQAKDLRMQAQNQIPQQQIVMKIDSDSDSSFDAERAMNQIQNNSCWRISDNSIAQAINMGEKMRMDNLFQSIRNNLLRSIERKSLKDIQPNITELMKSKQSQQF